MSMVKLTEYQRGSGCGCKVSPKIPDAILHADTPFFSDSRLPADNQTRDAAVYDIGYGEALISTSDVLCPPVSWLNIPANFISDWFKVI